MCLDEIIKKEFITTKPLTMHKYVEIKDGKEYSPHQDDFCLSKRNIKVNPDIIGGFLSLYYKSGIHGYLSKKYAEAAAKEFQGWIHKNSNMAWRRKVELVSRKYIIPAHTPITIGKQGGNIVAVSPDIINPRATPELSEKPLSDFVDIFDEVKAKIDKNGLAVEYNFK